MGLQMGLCYAGLSGIILRVFWWSAQGLLELVLELVLEWWRHWCKTRNCFYERALHRNQGKCAEKRPANRRNKSIHFCDSSSLTTLYRDSVACKVQKTMTSCKGKLPRISLDACLRKEYSGSFYVVIHWLSKPCDCCCGSFRTHKEALELEGDFPEPWISPMD